MTMFGLGMEYSAYYVILRIGKRMGIKASAKLTHVNVITPKCSELHMPYAVVIYRKIIRKASTRTGNATCI